MPKGGGFIGPTKSVRLGEMERLAPESQMTAKRCNFPMMLLVSAGETIAAFIALAALDRCGGIAAFIRYALAIGECRRASCDIVKPDLGGAR